MRFANILAACYLALGALKTSLLSVYKTPRDVNKDIFNLCQFSLFNPLSRNRMINPSFFVDGFNLFSIFIIIILNIFKFANNKLSKTCIKWKRIFKIFIIFLRLSESTLRKRIGFKVLSFASQQFPANYQFHAGTSKDFFTKFT